MMTDRRPKIISELESNMDEVLSLFGSLSAASLDTRVYQEGARWTVRQILAHFITIEQSMHWLFRNILAGGPGSPDDFDIDRFNRTQPAKLDGVKLETLMDQFKAVRKETIEIVRSMSDHDLDREGRHAFHGHGRLERFIVWAYEHTRLHTDDLRAALTSNTAEDSRQTT